MQHLTETDLSRFSPFEGLPPTLLKQAELETQKLLHTPLNFQGREQVRGLVIDPEGCLERDDAIWVERSRDGWWLVNVSIADVAEHIKPGRALDHIASLKGFTHYEEDEEEHSVPRTYMFPSELAEDFLSLRQGQPRLTMTVSMILSDTLELQMVDIHPTYLVSPHDFTYAQAAACVNNSDNEFHDVLVLADRFSRKLHSSDELDEKRRRDQSDEKRMHRIVGDFMLLANCAVAQFAADHEIPIIYRNFEKTVSQDDVAIGYYSVTPRAHEEVGKLYAHVTSPIRRLPDVQDWRLIKWFLEKKPISQHDAQRSGRVARRANVAAAYMRQ